MNIVLKPVAVTEEIMNNLESKGVIRRIMPGKDILNVKRGTSNHESVYECDEKYGPHKLICVTINTTEPSNFLYHNDNEDFMLIDLPGRTSLVITMAVINQAELNHKIKAKTVSNQDFVSVVFRPNDPNLSFFTMNAGFPHVETCLKESNVPPSFYVGESRDLDENHIDFKNYKLIIEV